MNTIVEVETKEFKVVRCYEGLHLDNVVKVLHLSASDEFGKELLGFAALDFLNAGDNFQQILFKRDDVVLITVTSGNISCSNSFERLR